MLSKQTLQTIPIKKSRSLSDFFSKSLSAILLVGMVSPSLLACEKSFAQKQNGPSTPPPIARFAPKITSLQAPKTRSKKKARIHKVEQLEASAQQSRRQAWKSKLSASDRTRANKIDAFYAKGRQHRVLIETDKPIYQPGQTIWSRALFLRQRKNQPLAKRGAALFQLIDPRGRVQQKKRVEIKDGHSFMEFDIPKGTAGGEYTLKVQHILRPGLEATHKITVSVYQAPRIKKKLDFLRKAYGAGEEVQAFFSIKRATGEALRNHPLRLIAQLDGKEYKRWNAQTNEKGEAILSLKLPSKLDTDDGLLNVLIEDAGVTESIARPLPLVVKRLNVGFFPEGGTAALGLPNRVYLAARRKIDNKPFDFSGEIRDDQGKVVARVRTFHDGMGRFLYTPATSRTYQLHITQPAGIQTSFPLPNARSIGFAFQAHDDIQNKHKPLRLTVHSKSNQTISFVAIQHETLIAQRAYKLRKGSQSIRLPLQKQWRGILRLTAFSQDATPLAERLIFRRYGKGLRITIKTNKKSYQLREKVTAMLRVASPSGKPIPNALLGISVVDDTVLNYADDHEPHLIAQRFLSTQLTGKIHKPNFYFDPKEKKAPQAIDLVMGTHGWRAFSWQQIDRSEPLPPEESLETLIVSPTPDIEEIAFRRRRRWRRFEKRRVARARKIALAPRGAEQDKEDLLVKRPPKAPQEPQVPKAEPPRVAVAPARPVVAPARPVVAPARPVAAPAPIQNNAPADIARAKPMMEARGKREAAPGKDIAFGAFKRRRARRWRRGRAHRRWRRNRILVRNQRIVILQRLHFDAKKTKITPQQLPILREMSQILKNNPRLRVCIAGHTSTRETKGFTSHNELALLRAQSVQRTLKKMGVPSARLRVGSFGPARPIHSNATLHYSRYNQRVSFHINQGHCPSSYPDYGFVASRTFPTKFYKKSSPTRRTDFRETLYWNPKIRTNNQGEAKVQFGLNDNASTFRIRVSGIGSRYIGRKEHVISAEKPFFLVVKAPLEVSAEDALALPLTLHNRTSNPLNIRVSSSFSAHLKLLEDPTPTAIKLAPKQSQTYFFPVRVAAQRGTATLVFSAKGSGLEDSFSHQIEIQPRGFPRALSRGGLLKQEQQIAFTLPEDIRTASPTAKLSFQVSTLGQLTKSLAAMLREPYGCFEQTSATNYPNVMIVNFLKQQGIQAPQIMRRAQGLLQRGYKRLVQYETTQKGFEWFGQSPGHEALTAYGLLQFNDMRAIFPQLDEHMVQRTQKWLRAKRNAQGGYIRNSRALDTFGRAPSDITDAYITFARAEANEQELGTELEHVGKLAEQAQGKQDPYFLALATASFLKVRGSSDPTAQTLLQRLLSTQNPDGSFQGKRTSITSSYGYNLTVETTALAILAMLKAKPLPEVPLQKAVQWLIKNQRYGAYGATQATILALRALIAYQNSYPAKPGDGRITVLLNGQVLEEKSFSASQLASIQLADFGKALQPGKNTLTLQLKGQGSAIPFALDLRYYTFQPNSSQKVPLTLSTTLNKRRARMGETIRMTATLKNTSARGLPMTLARLAFPGSLQPQLWQLKALKEKKLVDFYETRPRELILYWRSLAPNFKTTLKIDLVARITGNYNAAPSRTYLYYTNDEIFWTPPLSTSIIP